MTQNGATTQPTAGKPTVYRGPAATIGGVIIMLFCLFGFIDLLVEAGTADLAGAAALLLVGLLGFVFGPYPAAFTDDRGLRVRNPFRFIDLPWSQVAEVEARLSFIAKTADKKFTVWAIPVSLHDRRKAERQRLRDLAQVNRPGRRGTLPAPDPVLRSAIDQRIERLPFADQALAEMSARRQTYAAQAAAGVIPEGPSEVSVRWSPLPAALLAAGVVFVIIAAVVK